MLGFDRAKEVFSAANSQDLNLVRCEFNEYESFNLVSGKLFCDKRIDETQLFVAEFVPALRHVEVDGYCLHRECFNVLCKSTVKRRPDKRQGEAPDCSEAPMMNEGRSIVALVEVDTVDVIEAVVELFEDEHQRALGIDEIFFN